ncbi:MarR family winged helix-turn-helix transcriptional regulator [Acidaminococcus fermentans]|uniref:MarR family winged helix-turn-helix transcriptional regulator n=1 Tax=Acidaminococcus fermentans TaxID=905 RepID=UPI002490BDF0|nr:MarR family winged helix-turn-helix transcriptional regulator [Acidaminococcus fermentans]
MDAHNSLDIIQKSAVDPSFIDTTFQTLNQRHHILYEFVMRYDDYIYDTHDYGNGEPLTMIESHTLTYIDDHPGTTVTELTHFWHKTKGAISQIVSRLEQYGLVSKQKKKDNAKTIRLYTTEIGAKASNAHKMYDILDITKTLGEIGEKCSAEEIDTFFRVLQVYYDVISRDFEENNIPKRQGRRKKKE